MARPHDGLLCVIAGECALAILERLTAAMARRPAGGDRMQTARLVLGLRTVGERSQGPGRSTGLAPYHSLRRL
jgi:hypothetical protein